MNYNRCPLHFWLDVPYDHRPIHCKNYRVSQFGHVWIETDKQQQTEFL